jgi:MFS family permease
VAGVTLGIVKQAGFNRQNGQNQAFNHAGNAVGAALSGYLGWKFGFVAVFILAGFFGVASIISTLMIPADAIDNRAARGMKESEEDSEISGLGMLLSCKPLLVLAGALAFFHLGNGAMLPLYGLAVTAQSAGANNGAWFVALTIIIAQVAMVGMSLVAMRVAEKNGYWWVLLFSFIALPIRGLIASHWIGPIGVYPVQILDGIGAGLQSVAVPGLAARILNGTGRINVGQGALMTVQGVGAALSPAIGGWLAQYIGYSATFALLGAFALGSILLWTLFASLVKPACLPGKDCTTEGEGATA